MPYPQEHMLMVAEGTLGTDRTAPFEKFSFSIRFTAGSAGSLSALDTDTAGKTVAAALQNAWIDGRSGVNDMAVLTQLKWNRIGTDGRYVNDTTRIVGFDTSKSLAGKGQPVTYLPPQCSLAVTLRTGTTRGLAKAGRFYLPAPTFQVDNNTGQIPKSNALATAQCWGGFIDSLGIGSGPLSIGAVAMVMSRGRNNGAGAGAAHPVTEVAVGRVIDTMRSRRKDIDEQYERYALGVV